MNSLVEGFFWGDWGRRNQDIPTNTEDFKNKYLNKEKQIKRNIDFAMQILERVE